MRENIGHKKAIFVSSVWRELGGKQLRINFFCSTSEQQEKERFNKLDHALSDFRDAGMQSGTLARILLDTFEVRK